MRSFCASHFVCLNKNFYVFFLRQPQLQSPPPVPILSFIICAHLLFCLCNSCEHLAHPICVFDQSFILILIYFRGSNHLQYWVSSTLVLFLFLLSSMRSFYVTHFVSLNFFFFEPISTLVASISFNNEFHQLWFSYLYSPHLCDHFAHPTLHVWIKLFTSFFCASPNFSGPHRSQYWVSSFVLICFFVCPIETYKNNGWFFCINCFQFFFKISL